jgi:hypothetical protein
VHKTGTSTLIVVLLRLRKDKELSGNLEEVKTNNDTVSKLQIDSSIVGDVGCVPASGPA